MIPLGRFIRSYAILSRSPGADYFVLMGLEICAKYNV